MIDRICRLPSQRPIALNKSRPRHGARNGHLKRCNVDINRSRGVLCITSSYGRSKVIQRAYCLFRRPAHDRSTKHQRIAMRVLQSLREVKDPLSLSAMQRKSCKENFANAAAPIRQECQINLMHALHTYLQAYQPPLPQESGFKDFEVVLPRPGSTA